MNTKKHFVFSYRMMIISALLCGVMSIIFQLFDGFEGIVLILSAAGIGSLFGGLKGKDDQEPHLPEKCFKTAFEWLLLIIMFAFAFLINSNIFHIFVGANDFINAHWPGLMLSVMCVVLALSGLRKSNQPQSV
jgi:hypothetical protein